MVTVLRDASSQDVPFVAQTLLGATKRQPQIDEIGAAAVRQLDALEVVPNALGWVELGGVTGQLLQVQAPGRALAQEVLDWLPTMDRRAIPDHEQLAGDLAQHHARKAHHIRRVVGAALRLQKQPPLRRELAGWR